MPWQGLGVRRTIGLEADRKFSREQQEHGPQDNPRQEYQEADRQTLEVKAVQEQLRYQDEP
jgi:hypothetical protein